jgi:hypothetical protein
LKSRMTPKGHGGEDVFGRVACIVCTDLSIQTKYCYNPKGDDQEDDDQDEKRKTRRETTLRVSNGPNSGGKGGAEKNTHKAGGLWGKLEN